MKNALVLVFAFSILAPVASFAAAPDGPDAIPMPADTRLVVFNYDPNVSYTILSRPQAVTDIRLGPDEKLQALAVGDTVQWITAKTDGHVFIKPIRSDLFTSATLVTNKRTYQLNLRAAPEKSRWYQQVSWDYPDLLIYNQHKQSSSFSAQDNSPSAGMLVGNGFDGGGNLSAFGMTDTQKPAATPGPEAWNWNYKIKGEAEFAPKQVFDDGQFTYLRIEGNKEFPAVFMLDKDGKPEFVNFVIKGDYILVQRVAPGILLKLGKEEVRIERKG